MKYASIIPKVLEETKNRYITQISTDPLNSETAEILLNQFDKYLFDYMGMVRSSTDIGPKRQWLWQLVSSGFLGENGDSYDGMIFEMGKWLKGDFNPFDARKDLVMAPVSTYFEKISDVFSGINQAYQSKDVGGILEAVDEFIPIANDLFIFTDIELQPIIETYRQILSSYKNGEDSFDVLSELQDNISGRVSKFMMDYQTPPELFEAARAAYAI